MVDQSWFYLQDYILQCLQPTNASQVLRHREEFTPPPHCGVTWDSTAVILFAKFCED